MLCGYLARDDRSEPPCSIEFEVRLAAVHAQWCFRHSRCAKSKASFQRVLFFGIILSRIERAGLLGWLLGTSGAKVCHNDLLLMKATHHYGVSEVPSIAYNQLGLLLGHAVLRAAGASNNLLGPSRLTQRMAEQRAGMEQKSELAIPTLVRWLFFAIRRFGCVFHRWVLPRPSPRWLHVGLQGRPAGAGNLSSLLACSSLY